MPRSRGDNFKINTSPLLPVIFVVVLRFVKIKKNLSALDFKFKYSLKLFSVLFFFWLRTTAMCRVTRFVTQFSGQPSHSHVSVKIGFLLTNLR